MGGMQGEVPLVPLEALLCVCFLGFCASLFSVWGGGGVRVVSGEWFYS